VEDEPESRSPEDLPEPVPRDLGIPLDYHPNLDIEVRCDVFLRSDHDSGTINWTKICQFLAFAFRSRLRGQNDDCITQKESPQEHFSGHVAGGEISLL